MLPFRSGASLNREFPKDLSSGPLIFLIYKNDLEKNIKSGIKFFADDTMWYSIASDERLSASELIHDLKLIKDLAYRWKMAFNLDPNKQAVVIDSSQKKIKPIHPPIVFNGEQAKRVDNHTNPGLTLDSKLTFTNHLNEKIVIAKKRCWLYQVSFSTYPCQNP